LNGTVVRCSDAANPMTSASATIQIIDTSQSELIGRNDILQLLHVACHSYSHPIHTDIEHFRSK
jgi:hypothetical protein